MKFRPHDEDVAGGNFALSTTHPNLVSKQVGITLGVSAPSQQVAAPSRWLLLANYSNLRTLVFTKSGENYARQIWRAKNC